MATSVDWERAWLKLKAHLRTKPSHGKRELFDVMGDIEVECMAADLLPQTDPDAEGPVERTGLRAVQ